MSKKKKTQATTYEELHLALKAMGVVPSGSDEFRTVNQLCDEWQCGCAKVRKMLRMAKVAGLLETGATSVEAIDGTKRLQTGYRIKSDD